MNATEGTTTTITTTTTTTTETTNLISPGICPFRFRTTTVKIQIAVSIIPARGNPAVAVGRNSRSSVVQYSLFITSSSVAIDIRLLLHLLGLIHYRVSRRDDVASDYSQRSSFIAGYTVIMLPTYKS
ncbi:hypothetical protein QTP88_012021 [Uroleucon formosanum]